MKYRASLGNHTLRFNLENDRGNYTIAFEDGTIIDHITQINENTYSINIHGIVHTVSVANGHHDTINVILNHHHIPVLIKDERALLLEKVGISKHTSDIGGAITAPIPGLLIKLLVKKGDRIKTGDPVAILEAMKMENEIHSISDGHVSGIEVKEGEQLEKDQVVMTIEVKE